MSSFLTTAHTDVGFFRTKKHECMALNIRYIKWFKIQRVRHKSRF